MFGLRRGIRARVIRKGVSLHRGIGFVRIALRNGIANVGMLLQMLHTLLYVNDSA
jgi:hypothetical protein